MVRYIGPKSRIARRFGEPIFGADKVIHKKQLPSRAARQWPSSQAVRVWHAADREAEGLYTYGVLERQFRNLFGRSI